MSLVYRSDIDGLRGVSVAAVVLFHYGLGQVTGGFVGVDVFFVISGFLITSIVYESVVEGRFSLLDFYDRRFRRILPALLVVILVSMAVGYVVLLPDDFARLAEQSGFAALGISNFYFLSHNSYFDAAAELQPMLHTWSLALEEQFYLGWPLAIYLICRFARSRKNIAVGTVIGILIAASFTSSVILTQTDQPFSFYVLPTRGWELGMGALLVFLPALSGAAAQVLPAVGLVTVLSSVFLLNDTLPFPGWVAAIPCLGAALVIWPRRSKAIAVIPLQLAPFVWLGKISYSLYLWHWPVLVLFRTAGLGNMPTLIESLFLGILSTGLACASYFLVETPFRRLRIAKIASVFIGFAAIAAVSGLTVFVLQSGGLEWRLSEDQRVYLRTAADRNQHGGSHKCFLGGSTKSLDEFNRTLCLPEPDGRPPAILVGESFAEQYEIGLQQVFPEVQFSTATSSGCHPVLPLEGTEMCVAFEALVFDDLIRNGSFDTVILASRWRPADAAKLNATAEALRPFVKHIVLLGSPPTYTQGLPTLLVKSAILHDGGRIIDNARQWPQTVSIDAQMSAASEGAGMSYYSALPFICPDGTCKVLTPNGTPIQIDYGHFSREAASILLEHYRDLGLLSEIILQESQ